MPQTRTSPKAWGPRSFNMAKLTDTHIGITAEDAKAKTAVPASTAGKLRRKYKRKNPQAPAAESVARTRVREPVLSPIVPHKGCAMMPENGMAAMISPTWVPSKPRFLFR